jgi:hypothetical protein
MVRSLPVPLAAFAWASGLLAACAGGNDDGTPAEIVPLEPVQLLTRASLDLRGVRPTVAEIEAVEADPAALDTTIETFYGDPRFGTHVADLFAEVFLTRTESFLVSFEAYDIDAFVFADVLRSVGDEPLRVVGHVAANDLPITDLVTADWTMADEKLAAMWPLDYPAGDTGWKQVHYTDGRPSAGLLASNALWWRYQSTESNANRKRANTTSRIFLCNDYLIRPIEFDRNVNLLDEAAVQDALRTDPGCLNCHTSLDPLAAYFFGFWWYEPASTEIASYHPSRERNWEDYLGTPPAYYGTPGSSLSDLGQSIAADNRFPECMVRHVTELLLRRDAGLLDADDLTLHREALLESGLTLSSVFRSVIASPAYRAATDAGLPGTQVPLKMVTPALLGSQIEDLTGFAWKNTSGGDLLQTDAMGFLTLAGGADGVYAVEHSTAPNTTLLLVQERIAEAAADFVTTSDATAGPTNARLFDVISFDETPETDTAAMTAQIQSLHLRLFGDRVAADGPEVTSNLALWSDLYAVDGDPVQAWSGLLSALLRDPDFLFY